MPLCPRCAKIRLEPVNPYEARLQDGKFSSSRSKDVPYILRDTAQMEAEVEKGCEGCEGCVFFAGFLSDLEESESQDRLQDGKREVLQAQLHRDGHTCRVDLCFWRGSDRRFSRFPLRICSTFGEEPSKWAETHCKDGTQIAEHPLETSLGRRIADNSKNEECLDLLSAWLDRCKKYHEDKCPDQQEVELPSRLIYVPRFDTESLKIQVTRNQSGRYVALSHCWGINGIDKKVQTTLKSLGEKLVGFEASSLPQSFQDAISITRKLGFEYLWIDALCIVQDDNDDWSFEASQMAKVYGNALLTLSADRADSSKGGIFGERSTRRSSGFGGNGEWFLQQIGDGWRTIDDMPLSERGWAFQERFLSPRKIHYLDEQMAWECRTGILLEEHRSCLVPQGHFAQFLFNEWTGHDQVEGVQTLCQDDTEHPTYNSTNTMFRVHSWNECIREWSYRKFTDEQDRLPSLSGLATAAQTPKMGHYHAGLWQYDIFNSMAWYPAGQHAVNKASDYIAPSWSWASAGCPISWCHGLELDWYKYGLYETESYKRWEANFAPHLQDSQIFPLNDTDPKGKVHESSYLVINFWARDIYVGDSPTVVPCSRCLAGEINLHGPHCRQPWDSGIKIRMDSSGSKWNVSGAFVRDSVTREVDSTVSRITKYVCVQTSVLFNPLKYESVKIVGLLLQEINGGFCRVGIVSFDPSSCNLMEWKRKVLKLY